VSQCGTVVRRIALWLGFCIACSAAATLLRSGRRWLIGTAPAPTLPPDRRSATARRSGRDRRAGTDRRRSQSSLAERIGAASNRRTQADRRSGRERRSGTDRRRLVALEAE
jgi:hypothetical protein